MRRLLFVALGLIGLAVAPSQALADDSDCSETTGGMSGISMVELVLPVRAAHDQAPEAWCADPDDPRCALEQGTQASTEWVDGLLKYPAPRSQDPARPGVTVAHSTPAPSHPAVGVRRLVERPPRA